MTDHWGETLYELWLSTNKGAPIPMVEDELEIKPFVRGDLNDDGVVSTSDLVEFLAHWGGGPGPADLNGDRFVDGRDLAALLANW